MSKITLTVSIKQFDTADLIKELYERVYDHMHDEEPQYDPCLHNLPDYEKDDMRQALAGALETNFDE